MNFSFTPLEPTFLQIGSLKFRYYGLMYVLAFALCYLYLDYLRKKKKLKISPEKMWDLLFYGLLAVVVGGRLGEVLIYNLSYYINNPLKIIAVWEGGMSFHGGLIAVLITEYFFCKKYKLNFWQLGDYLVLPLSLGLGIARFGNFINGELYGRTLESTFYVPWGMKFARAGDALLRHPSQLYEVGKNFIIFAVLIFLYKKYSKLKSGTLLSVFLFGYGFLRFLIEFVREPDPQIGLFFGVFSMGQVLCFLMMLAAVWIKYKLKK